MHPALRDEARGLLSGIGAFFIWGCAPAYFKWLSHVSPIEVATHRAVWSLLFVAMIVVMTGKGRLLAEIFRDPRKLAVFVVTTLLLAGTGVVTAAPLILFVTAARHLTFTAVGLLQYMSPTLQALLAVFLYHEPFGQIRLMAFGLIIYSVDGYRRRRAADA